MSDAHADPHAEVIGLDRIPADQRPPTLPCHVAFQIMVGAGSLLVLSPGTYNANVLMWKPLKIQGLGPGGIIGAHELQSSTFVVSTGRPRSAWGG